MNFRWPRHRGSVLILVLWAIGFLAVVAASFGAGVRARLALVDRLEQRRVLSWLAMAGYARLRNFFKEAAFQDEPDLSGLMRPVEFSIGSGAAGSVPQKAEVTLRLASEEAKININLSTFEQIKRLLTAIGETDGKAQEMAAAVIDWRDPDSEPGLFGAEDLYYESLGTPYPCKDAPFDRLDELLLVRGFNAKILRVLQFYVTVVGDGPVLIDRAAIPVMVALGLTPELADKIYRFRAGEDGLPGSPDDVFLADSFFPADVNPAVRRLRELTPVSKEEAEALTVSLTDGRFGNTRRFYALDSFVSLTHKRGGFHIEAIVERSFEPDEAGVYTVKLRSWRTFFEIG